MFRRVKGKIIKFKKQNCINFIKYQHNVIMSDKNKIIFYYYFMTVN